MFARVGQKRFAPYGLHGSAYLFGGGVVESAFGNEIHRERAGLLVAAEPPCHHSFGYLVLVEERLQPLDLVFGLGIGDIVGQHAHTERMVVVAVRNLEVDGRVVYLLVHACSGMKERDNVEGAAVVVFLSEER